MHMLDLVTDIVMASSSSSVVGMEISEPFRTEDLSKTDFFDFVTGSAPDMAITSSSGNNNNNNNNSGSCTRVMTGIVTTGLGGSTVTDRPPPGGNPGRNPGPGNHSDGSPANRGSTMNTATPVASNNGPSDGNDQPLQGFDQFWGSDKDVNRLDPAMFEDLNRYCWIQQNNNNNTSNANNNNSNNSNNGVLNNQMADTDGQIYTLTVLNGTPEPWVLRKDPNTAEPTAPASNLDLDTILGGFPGYVKTECFSYDDSGFGTDHHAKEDPHQQQQQQQHQHQQHLLVQQQHTHSQLQQVQPQQQQQQMPVSSSNIVLSSNLLDPNSVLAYQNNNNNNNDWQMSDHNVIQQETPESLLRSALQGKGYTKGTGMQLQNGGVTVLQSPGHMKDEELRRVLYSTGDPSDSLSAYADSTLTNGMYDDSVLHSPASTNQSLPTTLQQHQEHQQQQQQHPQQVQSQMTGGVTQTGQQQVAGDMSAGGGGEGGGGPTAASVVVDDMFLTLDAAFTEDYEKLKRIETEVQQFCSDNNNYTEIIVETGPIGTLPSANSNHVNSTGNLLITATTTSTGPNQHQHQHHPGAGSATAMVLTPASGIGSVSLNARQPTVSTTTSSDMVTTTSPTKAKAPRAKKSYKRSLSSNANSNAGSNQTGSTTGNPQMLSSPTSTNLTCLATSNNNNNNTSMNNLNSLSGGGMLSPTGGTGSSSISSGGSSTTTTTTTSPTQCGNGGGGGTGVAGGQQRKERSLHYCSICSKGFKDKYSVNVHIRTHTGEKPFACSLCGKSFRQKAHLAKHYQTHLAQKNPAGGGSGGGTVSKQSKQSRLAAPPPTDPVTSGQLTSPVSGPTAAPPPSLPNDLVSSLTVVQSGSPPMLLNTAATTVSQIVASR
uniref:Putative wrky transcription factor protein 1 n=1 Tax=Anopheles darlingi TaxID=43151 RepID=A0A2M4CRT6_ANODA